MLKKAILSMLISISASAQQKQVTTAHDFVGNDSGRSSLSEFYYQPSGDSAKFSLTPIFSNAKYEGSFNVSKQTKSKNLTEQRFEFAFNEGLSQDLALAVQTDFGNVKWTNSFEGQNQDFKASGLSDFHFSLTKTVSDSDRNIQMGGILSLSPDKSKYAYVDQDANRFSGGNSISPFVRLETATSFGVAGGGLSYTLKGKREFTGKLDEGGTETGGNKFDFTVFMELSKAVNSWGAALSLKQFESRRFEDNDGSKDDDSSTQNASLNVYGHFPFANKMAFKPELVYSTLLTKSVDGFTYSAADSTNLQFGLEALF